MNFPSLKLNDQLNSKEPSRPLPKREKKAKQDGETSRRPGEIPRHVTQTSEPGKVDPGKTGRE